MNSVRRTALTWMTLLLTLVGLVGSGGAYVLDLMQADRLLDGQLRQIALNAAPGLRDTSPFLRGHGTPQTDPGERVLLQIWNEGPDIVYSSEPDSPIPRLRRDGFETIEAGGERWRTYRVSEGRQTVQASQRLRVRTILAQTAALEAAVPILVTIPLGWLVVGLGLRRVLGRLSILATDVAARGAETRHSIPVTDIPEEVLPLVEAMNLLIGRLQTSLEQQKRFLSDAAHELRTPLAALRLQIDNVLPHHEDAVLDAALVELGRGTDRAAALIDQLLRLARYDAVTDMGGHETIDLVPLILSCLADHLQIAEVKQVDLGVVASDPATMLGNAKDLKILFDNLIQNAVRYTPSGGIVDVAIRSEAGDVTVEVSDTGCGIKENLLPRVFDRFFRAAPPDIQGTGLGLAICKAIADRHGLTITLSNRPAGGLMARVTASRAAG